MAEEKIPPMPTARERTAWLLHERQKLTDAQVGEVMKCHAVTVNRLRSSFKKKILALLAFNPGDDAFFSKLMDGESMKGLFKSGNSRKPK